VQRHCPREAAFIVAQQGAAFLGDGRPNVGGRPDVDERKDSGGSLDEAAGDAHCGERLRGEINRDEDSKRRDHLADSIAATDARQ
jgi:hypothetical protein